MKPYKGWRYRVIVDGELHKLFRVLVPLTAQQERKAANDYSEKLGMKCEVQRGF